MPFDESDGSLIAYDYSKNRADGAVTGAKGEREVYQANALVIATGGVSYPLTGSTGDGYRLAADLGHTIVPPKPSLIPLVEAGGDCAGMQGLSLRNVSLTVYEGEKMTIEDALSKMGARKVYLMLRFSNMQAYAKDTYLKNLELLIYLIQKKNPGIEVIVLSQLPGISGRTGTPTNMQIFRLNLMTCEMCMELNIPYLDVAYAMRDANGDLPAAYCMDQDMSGLYLNDAGCDVWLNYIVDHVP